MPAPFHGRDLRGLLLVVLPEVVFFATFMPVESRAFSTRHGRCSPSVGQGSMRDHDTCADPAAAEPSLQLRPGCSSTDDAPRMSVLILHAIASAAD